MVRLTENIVSLEGMFKGCSNITGDISNLVLNDALLELNLYEMKIACNIEHLKVNRKITNITICKKATILYPTVQ